MNQDEQPNRPSQVAGLNSLGKLDFVSIIYEK